MEYATDELSKTKRFLHSIDFKLLVVISGTNFRGRSISLVAYNNRIILMKKTILFALRPNECMEMNRYHRRMMNDIVWCLLKE